MPHTLHHVGHYLSYLPELYLGKHPSVYPIVSLPIGGKRLPGRFFQNSFFSLKMFNDQIQSSIRQMLLSFQVFDGKCFKKWIIGWAHRNKTLCFCQTHFRDLLSFNFAKFPIVDMGIIKNSEICPNLPCRSILMFLLSISDERRFC